MIVRVLFVNNDLDAFLAHRHWHAVRLADDGHEVMLASGGNQASCTKLDNRIRFTGLYLDQHKLRPGHDMALIGQFRRMVRKLNPDIIHTFTAKPNLFMSLALLTIRDLKSHVPPLVMTFPGLGKIFEPEPGTGKRIRRNLVGSVFKRASRNLVVRATFENNRDKQMFLDSRLFGKDQCHALFGAGIDLSSFRPMPHSGKRTFLLAARLLRAKGVENYINASNLVDPGGQNVEFHLCGPLDRSNPDCVDMEALKSKGQLGPVQYLGVANPEDMPFMLANAEVVVLPSRLQEGFPRSLIEAAACGKALIASDQPSIRQILIPGENGWLIDPHDPDSLVTAMQSAIDQPDLVRAYGRRSVQLCSDLPVSEDHIHRSFLDIYDDCLSDARSA